LLYFCSVNKLTCILAAILTLLLFLTSEAQTGPRESERAINIQKAAGSIKLDGVLAETDWQNASLASSFTQNFPYDTSLAASQTEVRLCFDNEYLYVAATCWQANRYTVGSLKRDFDENAIDYFAVNIGPFCDRLNGFQFAVSPYGVQREGQVYNGYNVNTSWDNKWTCATKRHADRWTVEMAIPFKSLRYKVLQGNIVWHINFVRNNLTENERSSWVPVGRNLSLNDMTFVGNMAWAQPPPNPGANIALIPYVLGEGSKSYTAQPAQSVQTKPNIGLDAKIAVTPSMNLDLTVNPDFAQVEVDVQLTDLSRFELFFPERRQFFIENDDLFGSFGSSFNEVKPFFSRRIGLAENKFTGGVDKIPILAGARLSGRLNKDWRVGLMATQTAADIGRDSLPGYNTVVAAVQRRVFKRSNIAALFVNRQTMVNKETGKGYSAYNRVGGLEFNYVSESGIWAAKAFGHYALQPGKPGDQATAGLELGYTTDNWVISPALYHIGKNFNVETGFVPRTGNLQHPMFIARYFYPKGRLAKTINRFALVDDYVITHDSYEKRVTDWYNNLQWQIRFNNTAEIGGSFVRHDYTWLFSDFDPTFKYDPTFKLLKAGTAYQYVSHRLAFKTDTRKLLTAGSSIMFGKYFNGNIRQVEGRVSYRWQPYGVFSVNGVYTRIRLPEGFNQADYWVVGAKSEITFTKNIFWTTFLQYNTQANNININSRFQWRFKPLSDFFLVYTDNYFAEDGRMGVKAFGKKNRALVLKFNYWFSL
jgi:hypothetical protein